MIHDLSAEYMTYDLSLLFDFEIISVTENSRKIFHENIIQNLKKNSCYNNKRILLNPFFIYMNISIIILTFPKELFDRFAASI